jgi:hypothetical protein
MSVVTQLYFQIVEENNYMFRPYTGWAIISLRLEYRRKLIYSGPSVHERSCSRTIRLTNKFSEQ